MGFGIYLTFRNPRAWRRQIAEIYRDQIADAVLAEQLGFDHVWTGEHQFRDDAWSRSLFPIMGAIAANPAHQERHLHPDPAVTQSGPGCRGCRHARYHFAWTPRSLCRTSGFSLT